jgi:hypothetical protein
LYLFDGGAQIQTYDGNKSGCGLIHTAAAKVLMRIIIIGNFFRVPFCAISPYKTAPWDGAGSLWMAMESQSNSKVEQGKETSGREERYQSS